MVRVMCREDCGDIEGMPGGEERVRLGERLSEVRLWGVETFK
jgi:hypothetical protein